MSELLERLAATAAGSAARAGQDIAGQPRPEWIRGLWIAENIYATIHGDLTGNALERWLGVTGFASDAAAFAIAPRRTIMAMALAWVFEQVPALKILLDVAGNPDALRAGCAASQRAAADLERAMRLFATIHGGAPDTLAAGIPRLDGSSGDTADETGAQAGRLYATVAALHAGTVAYSRCNELAMYGAAITRAMVRDLIAQLVADLLERNRAAVFAAVATGGTLLVALGAAAAVAARATIVRYIALIVERLSRYVAFLGHLARQLREVTRQLDQLPTAGGAANRPPGGTPPGDGRHLDTRLGGSPTDVASRAVMLAVGAVLRADPTAVRRFTEAIPFLPIDPDDPDVAVPLQEAVRGAFEEWEDAELWEPGDPELSFVGDENADEYLVAIGGHARFVATIYPDARAALEDLAGADVLARLGASRVDVPETRWVARIEDGAVVVVRQYLMGERLFDVMAGVGEPGSPGHAVAMLRVQQGMERIASATAEIHHLGELADAGLVDAHRKDMADALGDAHADLDFLAEHAHILNQEGAVSGRPSDGRVWIDHFRAGIDELHRAADENPGAVGYIDPDPHSDQYLLHPDGESLGVVGAHVEAGSQGRHIADLADSLRDEAIGTSGLRPYAENVHWRVVESYHDKVAALGGTSSRDAARFYVALHALSSVRESVELINAAAGEAPRHYRHLLDDMNHLDRTVAHGR